MTPRERWGTVLAVLLIFSGCRRADQAVPAEGVGTTSPAGQTIDGDTVQLYFPGSDGRLHREAHTIESMATPEARVTRLIEALIAGPTTAQRWSPLPSLQPPNTPETPAVDPQTEATEKTAETAASVPPEPQPRQSAVRVYLIEETVYVDLTAPQGPPVVGSRQELLMLYSLVNTVLLNTPEANRLVVLWNGRQAVTFAGHIDTGRPLTAQPGLIAEPAT